MKKKYIVLIIWFSVQLEIIALLSYYNVTIDSPLLNAIATFVAFLPLALTCYYLGKDDKVNSVFK